MDSFKNKYNSQKYLQRKFKERMKDRHKINGIKFNYEKKEEKKYFVEPRKKEKDYKAINNEYEEFALLKNYNQLKHRIFVREQKEKEKLKKEQEVFKEFKFDFNYTNILKIIEQFLSINNTDKSSPFSYNIKRGKMAIELADRNLKINRINEILKRIVLHFMKIKAKLKINDNDEKRPVYLSHDMTNEIKKKIFRQKRKLKARNSKLIFKNTKLDIQNSSSTNLIYIKSSDSRKSKQSVFFRSDSKKSNFNLHKLNSLNIKKNNSSCSSFIERKSSIVNNQNSEQYLTNNSINYNNEMGEEFNIKENFYNKRRTRNSYFFNESKENTIFNNVKKMYNIKKDKKSTISFAPLLLSDKKNNKLKKYNDEIEKDNSNLLIEDNCKGKASKYLIKNSCPLIYKKNLSLKRNLIRPKSCININFKNKNEMNWIKYDKNKIRNNSCIRKKSYLKVKNLPLYTTKIGDLVKEYNRIKKNSRKLKLNYKEKHFSTYEEIDNIIKTKEDMLMFLLKQKYFNCKFPQKVIKAPNPKILFLKRMKEDVDLIEERPSIFINFEKNLEF